MLKELDLFQVYGEKRFAEIQAEQKRGKKVIGYFCRYTPRELIEACGGIPLRLAKGGDQHYSTVADEHTQPYYCPFAKSCIGFLKEGDPHYKLVDAVAVAFTCSQMRAIPEVWDRTFNVPTFPIFLPRQYERESALKVFWGDLLWAKDELERITGKKASDADLVERIEQHNKMRSLLKKIYNIKGHYSVSVSGKDLIRVVQASFDADIEEYNQNLEKLLASMEAESAKSTAVDNTQKRLMLAGSICSVGDTFLMDLLEEKGVNIVTNAFCTGTRWFWDEVKVDKDPMEGLARSYLFQIPCPRMRPWDKMIDFLKMLAAEYKVEGFIYYTLKFCDNYAVQLIRIKEEMKKVGVPLLHVEGDYSDSGKEQARNRIEAFLEMIS